MLDSVQQRANMVATQLRTNDVSDARLIKAVLGVAREDFVPGPLTALAYMEGCIPLGKDRVILDIRSFGKLVQVADIKASDRVLDVGCGTGYSTAIFAQLAAHVAGLEQDRDLATAAIANLRGVAHAEIVTGRLTDGIREKAPYDVIFLNGAVERTPSILVDQLANGGRLLCIFRDGEAGHARLYLKNEDAIGERSTFDAQAPVLPGFEKARSFAF